MKIYSYLLKVRPTFIISFLKKVFRIKRKELITDKGTFYIDPISNFGTRLLMDNIYEPEMVKTIEDIISIDDSFFDLGANEGYFSVLAAKIIGEKGLVYAVEPQSRLQEIVLRNFKTNKIGNYRIIQKAISNKEGTIQFSLAPDTNTGSSGLFNVQKYKNPTEVVHMTTLEKLFNDEKIKNIKLMKVDIEGLEYEAILGSQNLFKQNVIENIALELHPSIIEKRNNRVNDIIDFLSEAGYKVNNKYPTLVYSKK